MSNSKKSNVIYNKNNRKIKQVVQTTNSKNKLTNEKINNEKLTNDKSKNNIKINQNKDNKSKDNKSKDNLNKSNQNSKNNEYDPNVLIRESVFVKNLNVEESATIKNINIDDIFTVPTLVDLPTAVSSQGSLIYVSDNKSLYYSNGLDWIQIRAEGGVGLEASLQSIASLTTTGDEMLYTIAGDTYNTTTLTPYARSLLASGDSSSIQGVLQLVPGTHIQAFDIGLQSISTLSTTNDQMIYTTGPSSYNTTNITSAARSFLAESTQAGQRNAIGITISGDLLGTSDTQTLINKTITDPSNSVNARGLLTSTNTTISIDDSTPTNIGQILTTTSLGSASWIDPTMSGPVGGSTNNALSRFDGTSGNVIKNSSIILDDSGNLTGVGTISSGDINITGNLTLNGTLGGIEQQEITQLQNIDGVSISNASWVHVGNMNQNVATSATPTFAGLSVNGNNITNVASPTNGGDAVNKTYADAVGSGLRVGIAVQYTTAAILPNSPTYADSAETLTSTAGAGVQLIVDSVSVSNGNRILVKNQADNRQNGIYSVVDDGSGLNPWQLVRSSDFNQGSMPISSNLYIFIESGILNQGSGWVLATGVVNVDPISAADPVIWNQFNGNQTLTAGSGLSQAGNQFNINITPGRTQVNGSNQLDIDPGYTGQTSITNVGTLSGGTWQADTISVSYGGTGKTSLNSGNLLIGNGTGPINDSISAPSSSIVGITDVQTLSNKELQDNSVRFVESGDSSKKLEFELAGITTGNTRVMTIPDMSGTLVLRNGAETLNNKTLTNTTLVGSTNTIEATALRGVGGAVNTSSASLPSSGQILTATGPTTAIWQDLPPSGNFERLINVAQSGGDYTSIQAALVAAVALTPTQDNPVAINVYPGVYNEVNPIVIPSYVSINGTARENVIIRPTTSITNDVIQLSGSSICTNLTVQGATGIGGTGFTAINAAPYCILTFCKVNNCETGFKVSGAGSIMICTECYAFSNSVGPISDGFIAENGGYLNGSNLNANGIFDPIRTGFICRGTGSLMTLQQPTTNLAEVGMIIENGTVGNLATVRTSGFSVNFTTVDGIRIGTNAKIEGSAISILNTISGNDINLTASTSQYIAAGSRFRKSAVQRAVGSTIIDSNLSTDVGDQGLNILGELSVGSPLNPSEAIFGGGDSYVNTMRVFTTDSSETIFTEHTDIAKIFNGGSFPAFNSIGVGERLYISGTLQPFPGIKINMTSSINLGNAALVWEYWNGTTWIEFKIFVAQADAPYLPFAQQAFIWTALNPNYQIRFGSTSGWVTNTVNGILAYWIRVRISNNSITTIPQINQIKLHTTRTEIDKDGYIEFFGQARPIVYLEFDVNLLQASNSPPTDQDLYISKKVNVGRIYNKFSNNRIDRIGSLFNMPFNMDTSYPLYMCLRWVAQVPGGNIKWNIRYGYTTDYSDDTGSKSNVFLTESTAPINSPDETIITSISAVPAANKQLSSLFFIRLCDAIAARASGGKGDVVWINIEREGNSVDDTNNGDIALIQITPVYRKWNDGLYCDFLF